MDELILASADTLRNVAFYGVFVLVLLWESMRPAAAAGQPARLRWTGNLGLAILNILLARWLLPIGALAVAQTAPLGDWSLLGALDAPLWLALPAALLLLDMVRYLTHRAYHLPGPLWRVHMVHHADPDIDLTTGFRHHPFEPFLSSAVFIPAVALIGPPAVAIVIFEALHAGFAWFTHANARLPARAERAMRAVFVTPEMHRIHHSAEQAETDSNYGALFSFWDRLSGTYRAAPAAGYAGMTCGLETFRAAEDLRLDRALLLPFRRLNATGAVRHARA